MTPITPAIKKRIDKVVRGGAAATIIRAELNAEDHIKAKVIPNNIDLISMIDPYTVPGMCGDMSL